MLPIFSLRYNSVDAMGTFTHSFEVGPSPAGPFVGIEAVVDTGASYTQLPSSVLARFGITPAEQAQFTLADGRTVTRGIAELYVRLDGRVRATVCIIGDDGAPPLLGAYTLEGFGLTADPVNKRLIRTTLYLL